MERRTKNNVIKILIAVVAACVIVAMILNASSLKAIFKPFNTAKDKEINKADNYEFIKGNGDDANLADENKDSDIGKGDKNKQAQPLGNNNTNIDGQNNNTGTGNTIGISTGTGTGNNKGAQIIGNNDNSGNGNSTANGSNGQNSGNGNGSGNNGSNNSTINNGNSTTIPSEETSNNNQGNNNKDNTNRDDTNKDEEKETLWSDIQLSTKDRVNTKYGTLLYISAEFKITYYTLGESYKESDAVVTGAFLDTNNQVKTVELPYGGTDGYSVVCDTQTFGTKYAVFSYNGMSDRAKYKVLGNILEVGYSSLYEGRYHKSTFPGKAVTGLLSGDSTALDFLTKINYVYGQNVVDLTEEHSRMIAYLGDERIIESFRNNKYDSSDTITTLEEENGYLIKMMTGFRDVTNYEMTDNRSYVYYPAGDWGTLQKSILNYIEDVPSGYKIKRVTENEDDIAKFRGEQVLEAYDGSDSTLSVPMGVTQIKLNKSADTITTMILPESVNYIDIDSLAKYLPNLKNIVYYNSQDFSAYGNYKIIDGNLYSSDGTTLLFVPSGRSEVTIPASVKYLSKGCLQGLSQNATITFEETEPPVIIGDTGFNGKIVVSSSEADVVLKKYMFAFGNESYHILFADTQGKEDKYKYNNSLNLLTYKNDENKLAAAPFGTVGKYEVPDGIKSIGENAFSGCDGIVDIVIGNSVTKLDKNSLNLPDNVNVISISAENIDIDSKVFGNNVPNLKIYVNGEYYQNYLSKWTKILDPVYGEGTANSILVSGEREFIYVDGVKYQKKTGDSGEYYKLVEVYDKNVRAVNVIDNTREIMANAFYGCDKVEIINIPMSVEKIADNVFAPCNALETIAASNNTLFKGTTYGANESVEIFNTEDKYIAFECSDEILYAKNSDNTYTLLNVPTNIEGNVQLKNNTAILYDRAFKGCTKLKGIFTETPDSIIEIGEECFEADINIEEADLSVLTNLRTIGKNVFKNCSNLIDVTIPKKVDEVPDEAFYGCIRLQMVTIENAKKIGESAFEGCVSLKEINLPESLTNIGNRAFYGNINLQTIDIPKNVTNMGESCFENCVNLETVNIKGSLVGIARYTFYGCYLLKNVNFTGNVDKIEVIGVQAFSQCSRLEMLDLTNMTALTRMGEGTFEGCSELTTVRFPESLIKVPDNCFFNCNNVSIVQLNSKNITELGDTIFGSKLPSFAHIWVPAEKLEEYRSAYTTKLDTDYGENTTNKVLGVIDKNAEIIKGALFEITEEGKILKEASTEITGTYVLPEGTIRIEDEAFKGCNQLAEFVSMDYADYEFGNRCFKDCTGLKEIELGGNITGWGDEVFMGCTSLGKIYLGLNDSTKVIEKIGDRAFKDCTGLKDRGAVEMRVVIKNIGNEAFAGCNNLQAFSQSDLARAGIETIGDYAFARCYSLSAFLTNKFTGLKSIGKYAFTECNSFVSPTIPINVTYMGEGAFMNCANVKYVSFYAQLEEYPKYAFKNCPNLLKTGGTAAAFAAVKRIGESAYEGCTLLATNTTTNWYLANYKNLEEIGDNAFKGCSSLTNNSLAATIKKIGNNAFDGCTALEQLTINASEAPAFGNISLDTMAENFSILVPDSLENEDVIYKSYFNALSEILGKETTYNILNSVTDGAKDRNTLEEENEEKEE